MINWRKQKTYYVTSDVRIIKISRLAWLFDCDFCVPDVAQWTSQYSGLGKHHEQKQLETVLYPQHICRICAMVKSRYIGDGHPTFNRNPYNGAL